MLGDVPSIVPRRNYDIRTQCLKGTCSSSELPGRWHVPVLDDACPCRGCSSMFSPEASTWKGRLQVPLLDQIHCFGFPDRADDGVRTRGLLLGKQACYHCTTSALPCFFRIRRTAVTCCPPAERGMAGFRVTSGACTPDGAWMPAFANALRPFLPVVTDVLIPPAGAAGRTARASSRPGEIHGKRYSHASRIDRIRTCDPMLPKHVRYQTAPQSDIFDRTPWLTSYVRALLNAISSDSGTVLSSTTMLSS